MLGRARSMLSSWVSTRKSIVLMLVDQSTVYLCLSTHISGNQGGRETQVNAKTAPRPESLFFDRFYFNRCTCVSFYLCVLFLVPSREWTIVPRTRPPDAALKSNFFLRLHHLSSQSIPAPSFIRFHWSSRWRRRSSLFLRPKIPYFFNGNCYKRKIINFEGKFFSCCSRLDVSIYFRCISLLVNGLVNNLRAFLRFFSK